jgi:hypothetical protein
VTVNGVQVAWWLEFVLVCTVLAGVIAAGLWVVNGLNDLWRWWRRDRVAELLEADCDHEYTPNESGTMEWCQKCDSLRPLGTTELDLAPERSWEEMTGQLSRAGRSKAIEGIILPRIGRTFRDQWGPRWTAEEQERAPRPEEIVWNRLEAERQRRRDLMMEECDRAYAVLGIEDPTIWGRLTA